jgi:anti-sigma B factor antagonist
MNAVFDQEFSSPGPERGTRPDQPVTVTLPSEIDISNASLVHDVLAQALDGGTTVVIADATRTAYCDCAGVRALIQAHRQAATGAGLRLAAATCPTVRRIFELTGADRILDIYPTLAAARSGQGWITPDG